MAFCPLCGKKLPDNGICSCGRMLDANGNIVSNAVQVQQVVPNAAVDERQKRYETQISTLQKAYNSALTSEDKAKIKQTIQEVEASYKRSVASSAQQQAPRPAVQVAPQPVPVQQVAPQPQSVQQAPVQPVQQAPQPVQQMQPPIQAAPQPPVQPAPQVVPQPMPVPQAPAQPVQQVPQPMPVSQAPAQQMPQAPQPMQQMQPPIQAAPQPPVQPAPQAAPQAVPVQQAPVQPVQQAAPQQPAPAAPAKPAGPNPFGEAFKAFGSYFGNPSGTRDKALDGKISIGAGLILGGLYFLILWISMTLLLVGKGGHLKFLPAFGFGILGAIVFCGLKCGAAGLILLLSKKKGTGFARILATLCVDTVLADCILIVMSLFQFATMHFAVFFMLIYLALILYTNFETLRSLSTEASDNRLFWNNVIMICAYAFIIMISYIIYCNIPASAYGGSSIFSLW